MIRRLSAERALRRGAKPMVLLVEDDADTQALMRLVLRKDYDVWVAASGEEARRQLHAHPRIRLVLMDIRLQGSEDGLMLTRYIRSTRTWGKVPIIATTACTLVEDEKRARSAGCNDFLGKPFYPSQLLSAIERYLPPPNRPAKHDAR